MTVELLFSEPFSGKVQCRPVNTVAEVEAFADELLARYQTAGDILPGIDLRREGGESLSIAIAPFGWALVHTDANFDQHCTRGGGTPAGGSHDVRWEEPDSVPDDWFVRKETAVVGVSRWLADGTLAPELQWSDECL